MLTVKEILKDLGKNKDEVHGVVCTVKSVNGMKCECLPVNGNAPIKDVRLVADDSTKKYVLVPKVGSMVVVEFLNNAAGYVAMVSEITEVLIKIGTVYYSMNDEGFLLKKGSDTLKDILKLIVEAMQVIVVMQGNNPDYGKLTQAMLKINNLLR
jgi:hypothetical protein